MMDSSMSLSLSLVTGFAFLSMAAQLAGAFVCLANRRLTPWLGLVAAGFAGCFVHGILSRVATRILAWNGGLGPPLWALASILYFVSMLTVVFGLAMAFSDIKRRIVLALEKGHDLD